MAWFNYLKEQGFFSPSNNPAPIKVQNGYDIPNWEVLNYLEQIAVSFSKSEHLELVPEVLTFIKDVSENPVDNYKTYYRIIKILSMIPNEFVDEVYLHYIPLWVNSKFDTTLQTNEICVALLPKFLSGESDLDIKKAEIILSCLFELKKIQSAQHGDGYSLYTYESPFYLYHLNHYFIDNKQVNVVAEKCSTTPLYKLMNSVNILLRDTKASSQLVHENITYNFTIVKNFENLNIKVEKIESDLAEEIFNNDVTEYLDKNSEWLLNLLKNIFNTCEINESFFDDIYEKLNFNLKNDISSLFGYDGIKDLDEEVRNSGKTITTFSLILRDWLTALADDPNSVSIHQIFTDFLNTYRYDIPFFKRMLLYVVSQNWNALRPWFWKIIDNDDELQIFSRDCYKLELYYLLSSIANKLEQHEAEKIIDILDKGPQGRKLYTPDKENWQHRWLHALQENKNFSELYKKNNVKNNFKEDYANEGRIQVRIGNVSPFSIEEISDMNEETLVDKILNFENKRSWDEPNIDGFADELEKAVNSNPEKYTSILKKLYNAGYIYIYHILSGFASAWKANRDFNWEQVLEFCLNYISSDAFSKNQTLNNDEVNSNKNWVYGNIASLISTGCQNDMHSFGLNSLSQVQELLLKIIPQVQLKDIDARVETDFVMYSINSTYGKLLRSVIDYSLKLARNTENDSKEKKWKKDLNIVYNQSLEQGSYEAFTFLGMYFQQFMFLNDTWLKEKLKEIDPVDNNFWLAFMRGLPYSRPLSKEYYKIMYPCYLIGIEKKIFEQRHGKGLMRHLFAYYLWNYEDTFEKSLIFTLINTEASATAIGQLITMIVQQQKVTKNDSFESYADLFSKTLIIWKLLNEKIKDFTDQKDFDLFRNILYLNDSLESLSNENFSLIDENINLFSDYQSNISLIKNILRWTKNSPTELISKLSEKLKFDYIHDQNAVIELTEYLYKNNSHETANKIANKLAMNNYDFLRPIYQKYNQ
ncbi:hypothetical protein [Flavobacterium sp. LB2R40]|uniref:hypothetical protein n=1 Tax=Flavobacterium sp. LB2R40 TaxID=3401722 RepID=UPI003AAA784A